MRALLTLRPRSPPRPWDRRADCAALRRGHRRQGARASIFPMTSKLANYLALTKAGNFVGAESELAEDLVGMLAQVGCVPPQLGFGTSESRRRSYPANPPGLGLLVLE